MPNSKEAEPAAAPGVTGIVLSQMRHCIYELRGVLVMLDSDLAEMYGVETKTFNRSVARNRNRLPDDFMFQLTAEEYAVELQTRGA